MTTDFDFVAIGGGSAGFNGARVARDFTDRVAVVDGAPELGGLCILRGCMPSKTLLHVTDVLHHARHASTLGLRIPVAEPDVPAIAARKRRIIGEFADYRVQAMRSGKYTLLRQHARFTDPHTLTLADGSRVTSRFFLVATGSVVGRPAVPGLDLPGVWTSDDVLALEALPSSVIVLGGGIVACELAQYLVRLGARVTMIQRSGRILRDVSAEAAAVVAESLQADAIELLVGTHLQAVRAVAGGFAVDFDHGGASRTRTAAHVFNALGRAPDTGRLGLEAAGVRLRPNGQIETNSFQQTSQPHIYAGGDCTGPHEIVHLAVAQGELAARHAFGRPEARPIDDDQLVTVVFTDPPVARCGLSEGEAAARGLTVRSASYPFNDHGKSILMEEKRGYVKVVATQAEGRLVGAEIVGPQAGELIHIFSTALALGATAGALLRAPWYHPTLAEIVTYPLEELAVG